MDSPQSVVSPMKNSFFPESDKQTTDLFTRKPGYFTRANEVQRIESFIGVVEVYIHQARDIHNICIYQKQDVYAKLCLTNDPENALSTKIINGGGQNPVFNENLCLNVSKIDTSIKCEIWMLSRVKNYLEDQLLGFALVPLSEVVIKNGKLEKEFSLSSTDLFHSPAGFVQLSLLYNGATPDIMAISQQSQSVSEGEVINDSLSIAFEKLEFPDPNIANENHLMVSEYYGIQNSDLDSQCSDSLESNDTDIHESGVQAVENFSTSTSSPQSSLFTNGSPSASNVESNCQSSDTPKANKSRNEEYTSLPKGNPKEKVAELRDVGSDETNENSFVKPVVTITIEPESNVQQQDFVNMYMKSMQEFTESLAKMKLPMDVGSGPTSSGDSTTDQKGSSNTGARVFYGSRAFF